ncbi:hypothetical protein EMIT093MI4_200009 [Pseudomonas sp. IT-93MI4]
MTKSPSLDAESPGLLRSPSGINPLTTVNPIPQGFLSVSCGQHSDFTGTKMTRRSLDRQANGCSIERPLTPACLLFTR